MLVVVLVVVPQVQSCELMAQVQAVVQSQQLVTARAIRQVRH